MKLTPSEAETKRLKAVDFLRRIGNDDLADEFEGMNAAEYAERKGAELVENPTRRSRVMPRLKTKAEVQADLDEANDYIEELEAKLDDIAGIAAEEEEDETDSDSDDDDPGE